MVGSYFVPISGIKNKSKMRLCTYTAIRARCANVSHMPNLLRLTQLKIAELVTSHK